MEAGIRLKHNIHWGAHRNPLWPWPCGFSHLRCGRQNDVTDKLRRPKAAFFWRRDSLAAGRQAEAFNTFLAYAGRYTLSDDKVTHHVEISSIQNYVNKDMVRGIKFEGDRITLATPPMAVNGKIQTIELIWQRLPADP